MLGDAGGAQSRHRGGPVDQSGHRTAGPMGLEAVAGSGRSAGDRAHHRGARPP